MPTEWIDVRDTESLLALADESLDELDVPCEWKEQSLFARYQLQIGLVSESDVP